MAAPARRLRPAHSTCRFCGTGLSRTFVDLGSTPPSNSYLRAADLDGAESFYPLHAYVCDSCKLVQLEQMRTPEEIFSDYAYFSSYSDSWLRHCEAYAEHMIPRLGLGRDSLVVELASNDGYLLKYFKAHDVPVLGVEPAANVAQVAVDQGIPTVVRFFGTETARAMAAELSKADLLIGNNVLAHVPNINDFVAGMRLVLNPEGVITMEFPHLLRLIEENQFDTIYHEHFSYLSFMTVARIFAAHKLRLFDVQEHPTHGGSLRIFACHDNAAHADTAAVDTLLELERRGGLDRAETYDRFAERVRALKRRLLSFLIEAKSAGKSVVGYGAAAKGNTLLNYCGIRGDFLDYVVDRSPHKQGLYLPGTRIAIRPPEAIRETRPDYVLILPWNIKDEVMEKQAFIRDWGGQFVVPIPDVKVYP